MSCRCCLNVAGGTDDLSGKVVIVTGASDGIGLHTAEALASRNARVIMACRNLEKSNAVAQRIRANTQSDNVVVMKLDLASLASVKSFAAEFLEKESRLDILINNAGFMATEFSQTEDGIEGVFQVNHLGHFLLTRLLKARLVASAPSRVVNVASTAHEMGNIDIEGYNLPKEYGVWKAYGTSKLANVLFTLELASRWKGDGVTAYSLHPGFVKTSFGGSINACIRCITCFTLIQCCCAKDSEQGAQTSIYCAVEPDIEQHSGKYFRDCRVVPRMVAKATDTQMAARLWEFSEELVRKFM